MKPQVVVVGGGIIGSMVGVTLQDLGWNVTLLDAGFAGQATRASGGMLAATSERHNLPPSWHDRALQSLQLWEHWLQRFERAGVDVGYRPGLGHAASTPQEVRQFSQQGEWQSDLPDHPLGMAFYAREGSLDPCKVLQALHQWCPPVQTEVLSLQSQPEGVVLHTPEGPLHSQWVVLACGAWMGRFGIPVKPIQGQALLYDRPGWNHAVYRGQGYVVPRGTGAFVGATAQFSWNTHPTPEARAQLEGYVQEQVSPLQQAQVLEQRVGLRPHLPEPHVDWHPHLRHVLVATGHGRNGILLAPVTAQQIGRLFMQTSSASYAGSLD